MPKRSLFSFSALPPPGPIFQLFVGRIRTNCRIIVISLFMDMPKHNYPNTEGGEWPNEPLALSVWVQLIYLLALHSPGGTSIQSTWSTRGCVLCLSRQLELNDKGLVNRKVSHRNRNGLSPDPRGTTCWLAWEATRRVRLLKSPSALGVDKPEAITLAEVLGQRNPVQCLKWIHHPQIVMIMHR